VAERERGDGPEQRGVHREYGVTAQESARRSRYPSAYCIRGSIAPRNRRPHRAPPQAAGPTAQRP
jgi:hypothetical protein